jgi:hypothetical protein
LETNYAPLLKTLGVASLVALPLALAGPVAMAIASAAAITSATLIEAKKSDQKTSQLYKQKSREGQKS